MGDGRYQGDDNFEALGTQSQESGAHSTSSCPPCQFHGRLHRGFCDEGRDKCFKCGRPGHMLRKYPVGKGDSGEIKAPIALFFSSTPKGSASALVSTSGTDVGQNKLYALATR